MDDYEKSSAARRPMPRNPGPDSGRGERHEFVIANFRTESGAIFPEAQIVYGTYGHPNADRSNAVLLPSHYMANFHGYEWLIGPGKALDPSELFLVATELFGTAVRPRPATLPSRFTARASR